LDSKRGNLVLKNEKSRPKSLILIGGNLKF